MGQHRNPAAAERVDDPKPESYHRRAASGEGIVFDGADIGNPKSRSRVLKKGEVGLKTEPDMMKVRGPRLVLVRTFQIPVECVNARSEVEESGGAWK